MILSAFLKTIHQIEIKIGQDIVCMPGKFLHGDVAGRKRERDMLHTATNTVLLVIIELHQNGDRLKNSPQAMYLVENNLKK